MAEANEQDKESKTEEATPYKRDELRKKGQVAQSREIGTATILIVISVVFYFYGSSFFEELRGMTEGMFTRSETFRISDANIIVLLMECLKIIFLLVTPILIICMAIGFLANVLQTGFIFSSETMKFNFEKINPISGFKRLFSLRSGMEALKAIAKLTIIGTVVYFVIRGEVAGNIAFMDQDTGQIIRFIGFGVFKTMMYVGFLLMVLAIGDFLYQRLRFEKDIRMTKQEIREELKEREGDPNIRARIRSIQRQMSTKRMIQKVPKAQVIITNPTHVAVALQYNMEMASPKVIAKGADYLAEKIREIAREHEIPVVENKMLAWALYRTVKVGQYIPESLYNAVAGVLAFVMKTKNEYRNLFLGDSADAGPSTRVEKEL